MFLSAEVSDLVDVDLYVVCWYMQSLDDELINRLNPIANALHASSSFARVPVRRRQALIRRDATVMQGVNPRLTCWPAAVLAGYIYISSLLYLM